MLVIAIQIPTIIYLIINGYQASKLLNAPSFKLVNVGWGINILYLLINIGLNRLGVEGPIVDYASILTDSLSIFFFYLAVVRSNKIHFWSILKEPYTYLVLPLLLATGMLSLQPVEDQSPNFYALPFASANFAILYLLAQFFRTFKEKHKHSQLLFFATTAYALIQFLIFLPSEISIGALEISKMTLGFALGLLCKFFILLGLSLLLIESAKQMSSNEQDLKHQHAFSEKLNSIIGRTFHEVTPPLKEIETIYNELIDEDSKNYLHLGRKGRRELERLENAVQRIFTIITAANEMYLSDILKVEPTDDRYALPIPIKARYDIHNLNTLLEIAVMNFKEVMLKESESNHFVTDKISIQTEYGGNCNIHCNSVEIVQIAFNLLKNSFEAKFSDTHQSQQEYCEIFIKSKNLVEVSEQEVTRFVQLEIEDNGPGIDPTIASRAFQEGFSTKAHDGRGRGYGLSIVQNYTRSNLGQLMVESPVVNPKCTSKFNCPGTKFIFLFPKQRFKIQTK